MRPEESRREMLGKGRSRIASMILLLLALTLLATTIVPLVAAAPSSSSKVTLVSGCNRLVLDKAESIIPTYAGNPATLVYGCSLGGLFPAFWTTSPRGAQHSPFTPTFTLPRGWSLSIGTWQLSRQCTSQDKTTPVTSGHPVVLPPGSLFIYCLTARGASSFSSFSLTWSH